MQESVSRRISFPDINDDVWDQMMNFIEDPSVARKMGIEDVLQVALLYDKYEFGQGIKLCDTVLIDYFKSMESKERDLSIDVDELTSLLSLAMQANCFGALKEGVGYVWKKFHTSIFPQDTSFSPTMFAMSHLEELAPILLFAFSAENQKKIGKGVHVAPIRNGQAGKLSSIQKGPHAFGMVFRLSSLPLSVYGGT